MFLLIGIFYFISLITHSFARCTQSSTTVSGTHAPKRKICSGDLIFEDNFDRFDLNVWQHEQTLGGGGNWEFQWYTNNRSVSFVKDGTLFIKPRLLAEERGNSFLYSGTLDINGGSPADECTNPAWYGCVRTGSSQTVLNPIKSARIRTLNSFRFKYGKLETRLKLPAGDWLWPAFWLLPQLNQYGGWPTSGEIDVMESRGNRKLVDRNGKNIGTKLTSSTLHWGPSVFVNKYPLTHYEASSYEGFNEDWHLYQMEWTPKYIIFGLDNRTVGVVKPPEGGFWQWGNFPRSLENPWLNGDIMAPFDQQFYITVNLAVGGISFFPDDAQNPKKKPWSNTSPRASGDFWEGRDSWLPTWRMDTDEQSFKIDYVRVWAI